MPIKPILVANDISEYKAEAHGERTACSVHLLVCCEPYQFAHAALLHSHSVLTFVVETHLAGFAAEAVLCRVSRQEHHMLGRRTWNTQEEGKQVCIHVKHWTWIRSDLKKKKEKGWRKWKILLRITSPMEQFSKCDTQYTLLQSRFDHPDHYWDIANTWKQSKLLQMCTSSWLFIITSVAAVGINLDFFDLVAAPKLCNVTSSEKLVCMCVTEENCRGRCGHRINSNKTAGWGWEVSSYMVMWSLCSITLNDKITNMQPVQEQQLTLRALQRHGTGSRRSLAATLLWPFIDLSKVTRHWNQGCAEDLLSYC